MVVFVGDCPSKLNKDPSIAFVGSKFEKQLNTWIEFIKPSDVFVTNSHDTICLTGIEFYYNIGAKIVALGNNASKRLAKIGIEHFKLPHPSPLNRANNDKKYVLEQLKQCKCYIGKE
jgi:hypothetical protein